MAKKCNLFLGSIINKIDAKGRLSVPAEYRSILETLDSELILYRSFIHPCIEGCPSMLLEKMAINIEQNFSYFSREQDALTSLIYGESKIFTLDSTGRISLTPKLIDYTHLSDCAIFVGKGRTFQIWQPALLEKQNTQLRTKQSIVGLCVPTQKSDER